MSPGRDDRIVVLAPAGRDAALLERMLAAHGYHVEIAPDVGAVTTAIGAAAGAAILTEEALRFGNLEALAAAVAAQPPWSDFPILLLTSHDDVSERAPAMQTVVESLGNVTIVERPVRMVALVSSVRGAIRARRRQYETRALFDSERAARAEAEQANLAKDNFLAVLSHELRTPLTAIMGWARMLTTGVVDAERAAVGLATITRNAALQARLIDDLLDVSRIASGKFTIERRPVDLAEVVATAVETLRPLATAGRIELTARVTSSPVIGDAGRLQQVVDNLLSNAIKFTPAGGRVDVALAARATIVQLTVADTGAGIAPEFLPHVFDRFRQAEEITTRKHGGLGLGLTIVHQIVALHDGQVRATSAGRDAGTTFTVELPLATSTAGEERRKSGRVHPARLDGVRVLLVEDEPDTRMFLTTALEGLGAIVTGVDSASAAMHALTRTRPDVIVSDIGLPSEDGYALMRRIRALPDARVARLPAVALTAFTGREDVARARDAGFQIHLGKPTDAGRLAATLASLVA